MGGTYWQPLELQAEHCDPGIIQQCYVGSGDAPLKQRVKQHLLALGWRIEFKRDSMVRLRYHSPEGKVYYSLHKVCCDLMKIQEPDKRPRCGMADSGNKGNPLLFGITQKAATISSPVKYCRKVAAPVDEALQPEHMPEAIQRYINYMDAFNRKEIKGSSSSSTTCLRLNVKNHLLYAGWRFWFKEKGMKHELRYDSPKGKSFISLYTACKGYLEEFRQETSAKPTASACINGCDSEFVSETALEPTPSKVEELGLSNHCSIERREACKRRIEPVDNHTPRRQQSKRRKACQAPNPVNGSDRILGSSKRSQPVTLSITGKHATRTVLSSLINNSIVLPRQILSYVNKREGRVMKDGRITRDGIKCSCCLKVFSVTDFEYHASRSSSQRPAANMFLQDGRSLLECQVEMMHAKKPQDFPHVRAKIDYSESPFDDLCSACHYGGMLVLCDHCPSAYHLGCVGLEEVPEGDWFCPPCQCGICGCSNFNSDTKRFTKGTMLYCDQCEMEFHVGCLRSRGVTGLKSCPTGDWFCSKKCSEIFLRLRELVGKANQTSVQGISWTILRANGIGDVETMAEHHSKLCVALEILHDCFVTITEKRTQSDFVKDLVFNRESELRRLNFWGFYTMILEKGDEVICVATFRVFGNKVAEMPLVGTHVDYRQQGMCRLIVTELEKFLSALGVERLLLPAVPQLLNF